MPYRVQKLALGIILGENFVNYEVACTLMEIEPLDSRREQLCLNFARKNIKQENTLFTTAPKLVNTRSKKNVVVEPKCNYKRFKNSSIPYLSRLLNNNVLTCLYYNLFIMDYGAKPSRWFCCNLIAS